MQKCQSQEDPIFENQFVVYGSDQQEARYILTPALIQKILALKLRFANSIRLAFKDGRVFVAISYSDNLFEAPTFSGPIDKSEIESVHSLLAAFTGIIDELNLNTRIWTKT